MREPRPSRSSDATERGSTSTVSNRSLERGLELLRAFGSGATLLGNGDLVELTGLPKAFPHQSISSVQDDSYRSRDLGRANSCCTGWPPDQRRNGSASVSSRRRNFQNLVPKSGGKFWKFLRDNPALFRESHVLRRFSQCGIN